MRSGVLLDRDGVINYNRSDYVKSWAEFQFLPGALEALRVLASLNLPVAVISNQSIIGRGLVSQQTVDEINARMMAEVRAAEGRIDGVWTCPHTPQEGCTCRKPQPGLLLEAARVLGLDLMRSYFVGDAMSDIQAAQAVGCQPVLVCTGRGAAQLQLLQQTGLNGFQVAADLAGAVKWVYDALQAESTAAA